MTWHFTGQSGSEDGSIRRPFLPVQFRLLGTRNSVAAYLNMLDQIFELSDVSEPEPARHGQIRVYGTMHRRHPLRGGDHI
jgi:hypothetical protein